MYTGMNLVHMAQASDKFQEQMESMARRMVSPREKERERERERERHTQRESGVVRYTCRSFGFVPGVRLLVLPPKQPSYGNKLSHMVRTIYLKKLSQSF